MVEISLHRIYIGYHLLLGFLFFVSFFENPGPGLITTLQIPLKQIVHNSDYRNLRKCLSMITDGYFLNGQWNWLDETKRRCNFTFRTDEEGLKLLGRRLIVLLGDSQTRHLLSATVRSLGGDMKPGYWKRNGDEFMSSQGGRIVWPFFTQFSSDLIGDGPLGLRTALSILPLADVYVINIGHWNALVNSSTLSIPSMVNVFAESVPDIIQELFRIKSLELPSFLEDSKRCLNPLIIWSTPNHILPDLYREIDTRPERQDRPERVEAINEYLHNSRGLFGMNGPSVLFDMNKLSRMGGRAWVSDDLSSWNRRIF
jgi:hypothetical protein